MRRPKMSETERIQQIIGAAGNSVKARIVGSGLTLRKLAAEARISQPACSLTVRGLRRDYRTQTLIWAAFRRLTGHDVSLEEFWGRLLRGTARTAGAAAERDTHV